MAGSVLTRFGNDLYTGARSYDFVGKRRIWYAIAAVLLLLSVVIPILRGGFVFGIEFTGGSEFQVTEPATVSQTTAEDAVHSIVATASPRVTVIGGNSIRVQTEQLTQAENDQVRQALADAYQVPLERVTVSFIGPTWGQDITLAAIRALVVFLILAVVFMAIYFRTWKMSLAAFVSLAHDVVITVGVYGIFGFEITPAAVIGFLTILGYSLYDTVVVFDKVRENTAEGGDQSPRTFAESVNLGVNQTLVRSINTGVVAVLPVASILFIGAYVLGAGTLRDIALALFIGIIAGTYSTVFIAAPVYVHLREREPAIVKHTKKVMQGRATAAASVSLDE